MGPLHIKREFFSGFEYEGQLELVDASKYAKRGRFQHGFALAGDNVFRIKEIVSVASLMESIVSEYETAVQNNVTSCGRARLKLIKSS
jgi:hypothetical protein